MCQLYYTNVTASWEEREAEKREEKKPQSFHLLSLHCAAVAARVAITPKCRVGGHHRVHFFYFFFAMIVLCCCKRWALGAAEWAEGTKARGGEMTPGPPVTPAAQRAASSNGRGKFSRKSFFFFFYPTPPLFFFTRPPFKLRSV